MEEKRRAVLCCLSEGFEELETLSPVDMLRRLDAEVTIASAMGKDYGLVVPGRNGIKIVADAHFEDVCDKDYDQVYCGGGLRNAEYLGKYTPLIEKFKKQRDEGKWFASICASPHFVMDENHLIDDYKATSFWKFPVRHCKKTDGRVVVDKNLITSRSPGTALEFALKIVEVLYSREIMEELGTTVMAKEFDKVSEF